MFPINSGIKWASVNETIPLGDKLKDTKQIQFVEDIRTAIGKELVKFSKNLEIEDIKRNTKQCSRH